MDSNTSQAILFFGNRLTKKRKEELLLWLNEHPRTRRLYLFDSYLEKDTFLEDTRIISCDLKEEEERKLYLMAKELAFATIKPIFSSSSSRKVFLEPFRRLMHYRDQLLLELDDKADLNKVKLQNQLKNFSYLKKAFYLTPGSLKEQEVVICGSGPSLEEAILYLKKLEKKVYIFAAATAVSRLQKEGIEPDALGAIDPLFEGPLNYSGPLFCCLQTQNRLLKKQKGPLLFFRNSSTHDLDEVLVEQRVDMGWTVCDFLIGVASYLQAKTIYLLGVDLSYQKGKKYDTYVTHGYFRKDPFYDQKDFKMSSLWIKSKYQEGLPLIRVNSTKARVSIPHISLEEMMQTLDKLDPKTPFLEKLTRKEFSLSLKIKDIKESFSRVDILLNKRIQRMKETLNLDLNDPLFLLEEMELAEELYSRYVLEPLWQVWQNLLLKEETPISVEYVLKKNLFFARVVKEHEILWRQEL